MSDAQRVHHQLMSGPIRSELRNARETVQAASAFYRQAMDMMREHKELDCEKGFTLHIAHLSPDLTVLSTQTFEPGKESELYERLSVGCSIMAGLIFAIRDPDSKTLLVGAKPFLNTPLVIGALKQRLESPGTIGIN